MFQQVCNIRNATLLSSHESKNTEPADRREAWGQEPKKNVHVAGPLNYTRKMRCAGYSSNADTCVLGYSEKNVQFYLDIFVAFSPKNNVYKISAKNTEISPKQC